MGELIADRTDHPGVAMMGDRIARSQAAEIEMMFLDEAVTEESLLGRKMSLRKRKPDYVEHKKNEEHDECLQLLLDLLRAEKKRPATVRTDLAKRWKTISKAEGDKWEVFVQDWDELMLDYEEYSRKPTDEDLCDKLKELVQAARLKFTEVFSTCWEQTALNPREAGQIREARDAALEKLRPMKAALAGVKARAP